MQVTQNAYDDGRGRYCGQACSIAARVGVKRVIQKQRPPEQKACAACKKVFTVGGRGNPSRERKLCSMECQQAARHRACGEVCKPLSPTVAAYIAGIIDGEGSVMLVTRNGPNSGAYLRVSISNTHRGVLDWVTEKTGIGKIVVVDNEKYGRSRKTGYQWKTHGDAAESLLTQLKEYLIIKLPQCETVLQFQSQMLDPAKRVDKTWQIEEMAKVKAMNQRSTKPSGG